MLEVRNTTIFELAILYRKYTLIQLSISVEIQGEACTYIDTFIQMVIFMDTFTVTQLWEIVGR